MLKVEESLVRICGERGSHCVFLLASLFDVSAIVLAALAALTTGHRSTISKAIRSPNPTEATTTVYIAGQM